MSELSSNAVRSFTLSGFNPSEWKEGFSSWMKLADAWVKYVPRGKGWFPRWVGRNRCQGKQVYVRTQSGAKLAVEPSNLDVYTYISNHGGSWDDHVVQACLAMLPTSGVFYDIGASVGYISIEMAAQQRGGRVIAFEPQPDLAENVAISAKLNGFDHLDVYQVMLGDMPGQSALYVGSHSVHASALAREAGSKKLACLMTTLDEMVGAGMIPPPNAIKIDVEGAELTVFKGAEKTIREHRPHIIFESDANMDRYGYGRKDILGFLSSCCAYDFFFVTATRERIPVTPANQEDRTHADIHAVPRA